MMTWRRLHQHRQEQPVRQQKRCAQLLWYEPRLECVQGRKSKVGSSCSQLVLQ